MEDHDDNITLATLLWGVWIRSPFVIKLAKKTSSRLRKFMDKVDKFVNIVDMLIINPQ